MIVEEQILENLKMQNAEASWYLKTNSPRVSAELNAIGRLEIRIQKQKDLLEITKQQRCQRNLFPTIKKVYKDTI